MIRIPKLVGDGDVDVGDFVSLELCVPFVADAEPGILEGDPLAAMLARKMFIAFSSWPKPELPSHLPPVHSKPHTVLFSPPEQDFPAATPDGPRPVSRVSAVLGASCVVCPNH